MAVRFYESVSDELLQFAVIIAMHKGQFVFCQHRDRTTLEIPGGHREPGEAIDVTASRELQEETGATDFSIQPVCVYSVTEPGNFDGKETFGILYIAEIQSFGPLHMEIARIHLLDGCPEHWTYPTIQPLLMEEAARRGFFRLNVSPSASL